MNRPYLLEFSSIEEAIQKAFHDIALIHEELEPALYFRIEWVIDKFGFEENYSYPKEKSEFAASNPAMPFDAFAEFVQGIIPKNATDLIRSKIKLIFYDSRRSSTTAIAEYEIKRIDFISGASVYLKRISA
ncbi:hypothetical protein LEP1GSC047_0199 [Leptospira inadai serovar Lyme str. 10]|uniref:Uncharacterized protein n=2 Tax=Leptospira inadai serovar Lyme TaxID=293084 RepID=V6HF68_9LEPT|nr:hypothetical protein [Leptospira inadai]EQA38897.1 hypothetical protein LEP1GSC047_0199 [Leptospira inadai serovar Lyme str. 10]PNV72111.1 hypothetical protein BES34_019980 [Leptospira inadai serovar Lyme]